MLMGLQCKYILILFNVLELVDSFESTVELKKFYHWGCRGKSNELQLIFYL